MVQSEFGRSSLQAGRNQILKFASGSLIHESRHQIEDQRQQNREQ